MNSPKALGLTAKMLALLLLALSPALLPGCGGMRMRDSGKLPPSSATSMPSGSPETNQAERPVPTWALSNAQTGPNVNIGVGSGPTLDQATRSALKEIAARISSSVERQLRDTDEEVDDEAIKGLEGLIETRVTGTRFAGWERTRSAERDGVYWAEVRIDRRRLARDSMKELEGISKEVDLQLETAHDSALRQLLALHATGDDRQRASRLSALLNVLDPQFDRGTWETRRDDWQAADVGAREVLVFEVRADADSREIARWLEAQLVAGRLNTRTGECVSADAICIDLRSKTTEKEISSRRTAQIRATVALVEPDGTLIDEGILVGSGESSSDAGLARRKAMKALRKKLATFSVLGGLIHP